MATTAASATDVIVVGAGISGLVAGWKLQTQGLSVVILEGRARIGGRCFSTPEGVDLGASWTWPPHERRVMELANQLQLEFVPQRLDGGVRLPGGRAPGGGERLAPCGPDAVRINGGYGALARAIHGKLLRDTVHLGETVKDVESLAGGGVHVRTSNGAVYEGAHIVIAVPPRLAAAINFSPPLPDEQVERMNATATWAGDWAKVVATYPSPFWRKQGDSGVAQLPSLVTWEGADAPELGELTNAIAGVTFGARACGKLAEHASDNVTGLSADSLRVSVARELAAAFGPIASEQLDKVYHASWMAEPLTYGPGKYAERQEDPRATYGHKLLRQSASWGVSFAGTETESASGHVEGAIASGERAAREAAEGLLLLSLRRRKNEKEEL